MSTLELIRPGLLEATVGLDSGSLMIVPGSSEIADHISLDRLRYLLTPAVWGIAQQFAVRTRSYEEWLRFVRVVLRAAFIHQHRLTEEEQRSFFPQLFNSLLCMLDKLDRWEDYLACWEVIRKHTSFYSVYAADAIEQHGRRIEPFILSRSRANCHIHFLYGIGHRKLVIERKLAKKLSGRRFGNMVHAPQDELTSDEIRSRIVWLIKFSRSRQHSAQDWQDFWRARQQNRNA